MSKRARRRPLSRKTCISGVLLQPPFRVHNGLIIPYRETDSMTHRKTFFVRWLLLVASLTVLFGCRHAVWEELSPKYNEQSAPRIYAWRNLNGPLSSVFGTGDGKRLWAVGDGGTILDTGVGERWTADNNRNNRVTRIETGPAEGSRACSVTADRTSVASGKGA